MGNGNDGGGPADQEGWTREIDQVWKELTSALATQLLRMTDEGDHLLLEMPDGHGPGCTPYTQFAGFGRGEMLRAELAGNAVLAPAHQLSEDWCDTLKMMGWRGNDAHDSNWFVQRPRGEAPIIAAMVIGALRETYGVSHPQMLTYEAFGPNAFGAVQLGLSATEEVPVELPPILQSPTVSTPVNRDDLCEMVTSCLHAALGDPPPLDDDGDAVLTHLDQLVWVRVRPDQPAVEVFARMAHGVHSRRATAVEVALLNRDHLWTKWVLKDRDVWLQLAIPAYPFSPQHLVAMVEVFFDAMTKTRDDLALRVGGRVS